MCCDAAPAPPTAVNTGISDSQVQAAQLQATQSDKALQFSKDQWAAQWPTTQKYMASMTANADAQTANAATDRARYDSEFVPVENKFVDTANNWNSPDRAQQQQGAAEADVSQQFEAARKNSLSSLEGFGIDPSQTRYGALDLGTRVSQATAQAAAGTQSRVNTEQQGLALQSQAINIGHGLPAQVNQSYAGATNAGASGINAGNSTTSTFGNLAGTATQWGALSNNSAGLGLSASNSGFGNQMASANFGAAQDAGTGQLIGSLGMAAILAASDERLKTDIRPVGVTQGQGIPIYTYRYKADPDKRIYMGVMAQELAKKNPRAVGIMPSGYLGVDYTQVN